MKPIADWRVALSWDMNSQKRKKRHQGRNLVEWEKWIQLLGKWRGWQICLCWRLPKQWSQCLKSLKKVAKSLQEDILHHCGEYWISDIAEEFSYLDYYQRNNMKFIIICWIVYNTQINIWIQDSIFHDIQCTLHIVINSM